MTKKLILTNYNQSLQYLIRTVYGKKFNVYYEFFCSANNNSSSINIKNLKNVDYNKRTSMKSYRKICNNSRDSVG